MVNRIRRSHVDMRSARRASRVRRHRPGVVMGLSHFAAASSGGKARRFTSFQTVTAAPTSATWSTVAQRSRSRAAHLAIHWVGVRSGMSV